MSRGGHLQTFIINSFSIIDKNSSSNSSSNSSNNNSNKSNKSK